MMIVGFHLWHGVSSAFQSLGVDPPGWVAADSRGRLDAGRHHRRRVPDHPGLVLPREGGHDARLPGARRAAGRQVGPPQVRGQAGQPRQQAQVHGHRRRDGTGRSVGRGLARRAGLQRPALLHPRQPAPRAQHRRAGRHQRGEELQERRRQRLSPLLRHDQGRRLPRARSQRLPPGAALGQHHRPVRRAGRAVRPRVRRPARQPIVRRRAGLAHVLRARPDRSAAAARRLSGADAAGRRRRGEALPPPRDARPRRRRRQGARDHLPQPRHGRDRTLTSPTPSCSRPAATARPTTCRPTR